MRITEQSRLYIVEALRASARSDEQAVAGYIVAAPWAVCRRCCASRPARSACCRT